MKILSTLLVTVPVLFFSACTKSESHSAEHAEEHADGEHMEQMGEEHAEPMHAEEMHEEMHAGAEYAKLEGLDMLNASTYGDFVFGGQPTPADLEALKARGVTKIVDIRTAPEDRGMDEPTVCEELGLEYVSLPFTPKNLDENVINSILEEFKAGGKTLVHCGSGNRVQLLFTMHRVLEEGVDVDEAMAAGREVGMKESSETIARQLLSARGH